MDIAFSTDILAERLAIEPHHGFIAQPSLFLVDAAHFDLCSDQHIASRSCLTMVTISGATAWLCAA